jgi:GxxExxY protein
VKKLLNNQSEPLTGAIIGCALHVHRTLGPGLLESAYCECLAIELSDAGIPFAREVPLEISYRGKRVPVQYRLDLIVGGRVVVEVKSVDKVAPIHRAQLLSYLRLGGYRRGLLINFGSEVLRDGIHRIMNGWCDQ